uniref:protein phosphatase methylesterase-1 n=1 Tax=Strigamia maritima TaxID=126957 RepID=T1J5T7_STRMM
MYYKFSAMANRLIATNIMQAYHPQGLIPLNKVKIIPIQFSYKPIHITQVEGIPRPPERLPLGPTLGGEREISTSGALGQQMPQFPRLSPSGVPYGPKDPSLIAKQKHFQKNDGLPIHLKGGQMDYVLYYGLKPRVFLRKITSMPCTSCGTEFGIFRKEHGCKNCGFSFCGNCLVHKALIPKLDQKKHSVCATCFELLSGKKSGEATGRISPPAALQRRIDAAKEKHKNTNSEDQKLKMRLDRLREAKRGKLPSDQELEERLARLKDIPAAAPASTQPPAYIPRDNRSATEQSSSLLQQMTDEVRLDAERPKPEDEITRRFNQLKSDNGLWNDLNNPGQIRTTEAKTSNVPSDPNLMCNNFMQNFPMNIGENSNENVDDFNEVHKLMEATRRVAEADAEKAIRGLEAEKRKMNELKANCNRSSKTLLCNEDSSDDDEDENKLADKVIEKLLAESALDDRTNDYKFRSEKKEINTPSSDISNLTNFLGVTYAMKTQLFVAMDVMENYIAIVVSKNVTIRTTCEHILRSITLHRKELLKFLITFGNELLFYSMVDTQIVDIFRKCAFGRHTNGRHAFCRHANGRHPHLVVDQMCAMSCRPFACRPNAMSTICCRPEARFQHFSILWSRSSSMVALSEDSEHLQHLLTNMSALQREMLRPKLPIPSGSSRILGSRGAIRRRDYTPTKWNKYFETYEDVIINDSDVFRVYRSGNKGPMLFFLHGGGYCGLTWATLTTSILELIECQIAAMDLRGHGDTVTSNDEDLSAQTLSDDVSNVIMKLFGENSPEIILIGHSMGGAVAVHTAYRELVPQLIGLAVIDVVEGTAMDALQSMQSFLRSRPTTFRSIEASIEWCIRSGQVRNYESAKVSMPGQIKNIYTHKSATTDLEFEESTSSEHSSNESSKILKVPSSNNSIPEEQEEVNTIFEEKKDEEKETVSPRNSGVDLATGHGDGSNEAMTSREQTKTMDDSFIYPFKLSDGNRYTWRIDLSKTEKYWPSWFHGLSSMFLSCSPPKMLLLAGIDRLDKDLTIGQMQGKFQMQVLPQCGHAVHEDVPEKVAEVLATFMVRHKFAIATEEFTPSLPAC